MTIWKAKQHPHYLLENPIVLWKWLVFVLKLLLIIHPTGAFMLRLKSSVVAIRSPVPQRLPSFHYRNVVAYQRQQIMSTFSSNHHRSLTEDAPAAALSHLQGRLRKFLSRDDLSCKLHVAIAGGGSHFISSLAATPGASKLLLQGTTLYDRESYRRFVGLTNLPAETFQYTSAHASCYAAQAALRHAMLLSATARGPRDASVAVQPQLMLDSMGLACSSALSSSTATTSDKSRAFLSVATPHSVVLQANVTLSSTARRTLQNRRWLEDIWVSHAILHTLELGLAARDLEDSEKQDEDAMVQYWSHQMMQRINDSLWNETVSPVELVDVKETSDIENNDNDLDHSSFYDDEDLHLQSIWPSHKNTSPETNFVIQWTQRSPWGDEFSVRIPVSRASVSVRRAIASIQTGREDFALLLPQRHGQWCRLVSTFLPSNSLIFPGSFNPPHAGHIQLVQAALSRHESPTPAVAWFELSIVNADKPPLEVPVVLERLEHFLELSPQIPFSWGVVLTNKPLFSQKVRLLQPCQVSRTQEDVSDLPLAFCVGTDTLVRLIDPKYYNDSKSEMLQALADMKCHFYVGGRLDQKKAVNEASFVTGQQQLESLPGHLRSKFTLLEGFRADISSTQIRREMKTES